MELRKEIIVLEAEIMQLEQYLLSLYRKAFEEHMSSLSSISETESKSVTRSLPRKIENGSKIHQKADLCMNRNGLLRHYQSSPAHGWVSSDSQSSVSTFKTTLTRVSISQVSPRHSLSKSSDCVYQLKLLE